MTRPTPSIELTPAAAEQIRQVMNQQDSSDDAANLCLRVGVKGYGPQRTFALDLSPQDAEHDVLLESQGIRINCRSADASGLNCITIDFRDVGGASGFVFNLPASDITASDHQANLDEPPPDEQQVRDALHTVIDPEVGVNIVDLGLVYGVAINDRNVRVTMTMTTPACPLGDHIKREVQSSIFDRCPGTQRVEVEIVWEPRWSSDKISPAGKQALGWS